MKNKKLSDAIKKKYAEGWSPRVGKQHSEHTKAEMRIKRKGRKAPKSAFRKGCIPWNKGTKDVMKKNKTSFTSENTADEKHWCWKGDDVSYRSLHKWIDHKKGKPNLCEYCGFTSTNNRQFHWANLSGDYKRDTSDFVRLCVKCHLNMDKNNINVSDVVAKVRN